MSKMNQYQPDYAVPPGWILEEHLQVQEISHAKFARRCDRSPKLISEIIAGKAPIEPETARQFEKVLGVKDYIWMRIETDYQLHKTKQNEAKNQKLTAEWVKSFPIKELINRGYFPKPKNEIEQIENFLAFFRVASQKAWISVFESKKVAYRHSSSFKSDNNALATWLWLGEIEAQKQKVAQYDKSQFNQAVKEIRNLTCQPINKAIQQTTKLCNDAGVAMVVTPSLPKTALSGAAWWLSPKKAIIQLSARHKANDHFWFSFFHEAAHILLHGKKEIFVDGEEKRKGEIEAEADEWATRMLISQNAWEKFINMQELSRANIQAFSKEQGITPGIVVGMLQHQKHIPWGTHLNNLKTKLQWDDQKKKLV